MGFNTETMISILEAEFGDYDFRSEANDCVGSSMKTGRRQSLVLLRRITGRSAITTLQQPSQHLS
jgi:hypothetical protein